VKSQDKIITTTGDTINCKIINISDIKINYEQKNKEGNFVGKFISTDLVSEYHKKQATQSEPKYATYPVGYAIGHIPTERPIRLSASFGYGFFPSKFSDSRGYMSTYTSQEALDKYIRKIKNGINAGADFYGFLSDIFGLGVKYSFFASWTDIYETIPFYSNTFYNLPQYIVSDIKENNILHTIEASVIIRQWLDNKRRFAISETFSGGYSYLREEVRGGIYSAPYPNILYEGNGFSLNMNIAFEYFPIKYFSISADIGAYYTDIRNITLSQIGENGRQQSSRNGDVKMRDMSKLEFMIGAHFYLGKSK
jgi:hypothetical protein